MPAVATIIPVDNRSTEGAAPPKPRRAAKRLGFRATLERRTEIVLAVEVCSERTLAYRESEGFFQKRTDVSRLLRETQDVLA